VPIFFVEIILRDVCQKYRNIFPPKLSESANFSTEDKPLHSQCTLLARACSIRSAGRRQREKKRMHSHNFVRKFLPQCDSSGRRVFLKLWSVDHKWSLGSALVVLLY